MSTISLCMIVRNEEKTLARCLDSVKDVVDEIVIVDTGSTDDTYHIACRYTDRVYRFAWVDDFAAARNFAFSKGTSDYLLWLDGDDVLPEESASYLKKEKAHMDADVYMMLYHTGFDLTGKPTFSYYRERMVKNHAGYTWVGAVHEVIVPFGNIVYLKVGVNHFKMGPGDSGRNLRIYEKLLKNGETLDARHQYYYARELYDHGEYQKARAALLRFLQNPTGWVENQISACEYLAYCDYQLDDRKQALLDLLRSLAYDRPRAEICCQVGKHFLDGGRPDIAAYWYHQALDCPIDLTRGGFVREECYDYLPHIQLCVCYDRLGDRTQAVYHNEQAAKARPGDQSVEINRAYFAQEGQQKDERK